MGRSRAILDSSLPTWIQLAPGLSVGWFEALKEVLLDMVMGAFMQCLLCAGAGTVLGPLCGLSLIIMARPGLVQSPPLRASVQRDKGTGDDQVPGRRASTGGGGPCGRSWGEDWLTGGTLSVHSSGTFSGALPSPPRSAWPQRCPARPLTSTSWRGAVGANDGGCAGPEGPSWRARQG